MDLQWLGLIVPASYIAISTFFFCFPTLLCKKYKYKHEPFNKLIDGDKKFCIGHRGGGWEGPQNTIELFKKNQHRLDMFELDVCLTKDKRLVVHHDASLNRTCGKNLQISQCNYEDLPKFMSQFQSFGGPVMQSTQNKIPLLEQVFEHFPKMPMNIELKTPSSEAIEEFDRLVKKFEREHITIWGIAGGMNNQLRQRNPEVVNFYSGGQTLKIFLLFIFGLLPFSCLRHGVLDIPLATNDFYEMAMNFTDSNCGKCLLFIVFSILKCFNCLSWLFIRHLKKRGIITFYFILNSEEDYQSALSKGCCGIMTDRTEHLDLYYKRNNMLFEENESELKNN